MTLAAWADGARWALAGVFVLSALMKAARRASFADRRAEFRALGLANPVAAMAVWALPLAELALALLLLAVPARWPVFLAIAFLVAASFMLVVAHVRGTTAPCRCFGVLSGPVASAWDLVRNAALLGLAGLALATPTGVGAPTWTALVCFLGAVGIVLGGRELALRRPAG